MQEEYKKYMLLNKTELADYLGIDRKTLYNYMSRHPSFPKAAVSQEGQNDLFLISDVEKWITKEQYPKERSKANLQNWSRKKLK